jgi:hypothetical protein
MRQQARLLRSAEIRAMIWSEPRQSLASSLKKALVMLLARLAHRRSAGPRSRQRESRRGRTRSSKLQENGALPRIFWQNRMRAGLQLPCQIKYLRVLHGRLTRKFGACQLRARSSPTRWLFAHTGGAPYLRLCIPAARRIRWPVQPLGARATRATGGGRHRAMR